MHWGSLKEWFCGCKIKFFRCKLSADFYCMVQWCFSSKTLVSVRTVDARSTAEGEQLVYAFTSFIALVLCVVEFERHFHKLNHAFKHHSLPFFSYSCWMIQAKFLGTRNTNGSFVDLFLCIEFLRSDKQKEHRHGSMISLKSLTPLVGIILMKY